MASEIPPDRERTAPDNPDSNRDRKIALHLTDEFHEMMMTIEGTVMPHYAGIQDALGRLTLWGFHHKRYNHVSIYGRRDGDINAVYMDESGTTTYNLYAKRQDDGSYSYHS